MSARRTRSLNDVIAALTADTTPYLSCDECFEQICAYLERVAADPEHQNARMEKHLRACAVCAEEAVALLDLLCGDYRGRSGWAPSVSEAAR